MIKITLVYFVNVPEQFFFQTTLNTQKRPETPVDPPGLYFRFPQSNHPPITLSKNLTTTTTSVLRLL